MDTLGRELLDAQGYHRHALVCERHTGVGISLEEIKAENLPLPHRNMQPMSIEEKDYLFCRLFLFKDKSGSRKVNRQNKKRPRKAWYKLR
jgi:hypothetical protein